MLKAKKNYSFQYEMEHRHKRRPWPIPRLHERLLVLSQGRISCTSRDCGAESVGDIVSDVCLHNFLSVLPTVRALEIAHFL